MMVVEKSCPGSRTIREPRPEYLVCSSCGAEMEIWTGELKATCSKCGNKVYRAQQVSCIDWCPHAKECVGPEVYERLRPGVKDALPDAASPLDILKRDHERALDIVGLLHGAVLCLKLGELSTQSPIRGRGLDHLAKVLNFFEKDLGVHFRREEEALFPIIEKHIGIEKSPTKVLLKEHEEMRRYYHQLKEKEAQLRRNGNEAAHDITAEVAAITNQIGNLLPEHVKRENESLLPLAGSLLDSEELEETARKIRALSS